MKVGISVLMPVYNGEFFLEETLNSLINQSFENFEVICIDDGSTDNSMSILEKYAQKYSFIKVYKKQNEGSAAKAVNFGLKFANGEYFMYTSQDDLFDKELLRVNYSQALLKDADAVVPDTVFYTPGFDQNLGIFGFHNDYSKILCGEQAFSESLNWQISGFVLWRKKLLSNIGNNFFDFSLNADEYTTRMLYFYSEKVIFTQEKFYYRQNNPNSITKKWNPRLLESFITLDKLHLFIIENSNNVESDLERLSETFYNELVRIMSILYRNKNKMQSHEFKSAERELKVIYNKKNKTIKKIKFSNKMQNFKKMIFVCNYNVIKILFQVKILFKINGDYRRFSENS